VGIWGRVFAAGYDAFQWRAERAGMADRRRRVVSRARGRVLELGAGTGLNLPHYGPEVEELVLLEPEEPMARRLERQVRELTTPARVVRASAEELPFEDGSFDSVVCVFVLCTVPDPARALAEVERVLASGGRFLFVEHVRSDEPRLARRQDRLHGFWLRFAEGCHCNRRTGELLASSGLQVAVEETGRIAKEPRIVQPFIAGSATR
jgi:ubiquinone/menaquinone biosynthesis C-methylase UbiE